MIFWQSSSSKGFSSFFFFIIKPILSSSMWASNMAPPFPNAFPCGQVSPKYALLLWKHFLASLGKSYVKFTHCKYEISISSQSRETFTSCSLKYKYVTSNISLIKPTHLFITKVSLDLEKPHNQLYLHKSPCVHVDLEKSTTNHIEVFLGL